jgi:hypothetical protein
MGLQGNFDKLAHLLAKAKAFCLPSLDHVHQTNHNQHERLLDFPRLYEEMGLLSC